MLDWRCCGTPQVLFGGVASPQVTVVSTTLMRAVTPPHAEEIVAVEVRLGSQSYKSSFPFGYTRPREELLIPIALDTFGAHGSRWMTDVWVFNDSDETINLFPEVCNFLGAVFPCGNKMLVPAHGSLQLPIAARRNPDDPGMYLSPPTDIASRLHFSIRVHNTAQPDDIGFDVPVARRTDFRKGRLDILNVPVSDRFRSLLRIYDEMRSLTAGITVRAYDMNTGAFLAERRVGKFLPTDGPSRATLLLHDFLAAPELRGHSPVRIEVEEIDPNATLWAMLTLTDNTNERVTVLTSQ
ncbi:MAG: hypothetical protein M3041_01730 [Acidobacteriota bacterium]|nr:hypothetical protein [Acidobacteriota bacterium]